MKKLAIALVFLLVGSVAALGAEKCQVEVKIEGLSSDKGRVGAVIFNSKDGWPKDSKKAVKSARGQIKDKKAVILFSDLPPGDYAFAVIHDENENGKMDYRFGIPQEGYAFSNNATGTLGPPGFDDAKFKVEKGKVTQTIKMNN